MKPFAFTMKKELFMELITISSLLEAKQYYFVKQKNGFVNVFANGLCIGYVTEQDYEENFMAVFFPWRYK